MGFLTQAEADAATAAGVVFSDGVARAASRSAVPLVGFLGDSRVWQGHSSDSALLFPNSSMTNYGIPYHVTMMTGGRVDFPYRLNFGVGGITTAEIISSTFAQIAATPGRVPHPNAVANYGNMTPLAAMIASPASIVGYLCGTNDVDASVPAATIQANDLTIITALQKAGKTVIVLNDMPRGDATYTGMRFSAAKLGIHFAVSRFLRSLRIPNVFVADTFSALVNPASTTGDMIVGASRDGLHENFSGAFIMAQAIAPIVNTLVPPVNRLRGSNADLFDANNPKGSLPRNPLMIGTGTASPANWGPTVPAGITAAYSYITGSRGENRLQVVLSGTPSANGSFRLVNSYPTAGIAAGSVLQAAGDIQVATSASGYTAIRLELNTTDAGSGFIDARTAGLEYGINTAALSPPTTVPGGASGAYGGLLVTDTTSPLSAPPGGNTSVGYRVNVSSGVPVSLTFSIGPTDAFLVDA